MAVDESTPLADVWIYDLDRGTASRLTFDDVDESLPVWSPDDSTVYSARVPGRSDVYRRRVAGNSPPELVDGNPTDISPDGRWLLYRRDLRHGRFTLHVHDLVEDGSDRPWIDTPFSNRTGQIAPDGHWAAYVSDESGRLEVYLDRFPAPGEKFAVSTAGGVMPVWRPDGRELYYWSAAGEIMAVSIELSERPRIGAPVALFPARLRTLGGYNPQFGVSRDGQRFLVNRVVDRAPTAPITLIQHWKTAAR